ncbi:polyprenyl synthetase family protein [Labilibacter marinus]|uniref:polyprenyl synthetase family protein n=1 Tax=Labilibacter marinus TaxID=1477105 RepID=UPI00082BA75F|nr:polyprenyl synthetase family protein [Labilibacter marinus]
MLNIKELQELVNKKIDSLDIISAPRELYTPIEYTLSQGGKRIRPVLCLMASQLFKKDVNEIIFPALAVEVFHNFTLLHDDIMDNADVRRNQPTVHKKWDANAAILSGDAMMIKAYQYLCKCDAKQLPEAIELFNNVALGVCEGQQYDMEFETRNDVTVDEYLEMIRLKTAILLAGSLKLGAILAKASKKDADLIYEFGINIGLAFQLQDDYLDSFGNQDSFGKKIGGDIVANKKTFLLLSAFKNAKGEDQLNLNHWVDKKDFNSEEKINAVKQIYSKLKVDKLSEEKMNGFYEKAVHCLSQIEGENEAKKELLNFSSKLMHRIN